MDIFEQNYKLLLEKLGIDITSFSLREGITIEKSAKGEPTVKAGDSYIHSKYDPIAEARKVISAAQGKKYDCWVFGGFGLGYYVESFLDTNDDAKIIIVEPEISLLAAAAQARDLEKIICSDRIFFVISTEPETVSSILSAKQFEKINYLGRKNHGGTHPGGF
jgi:hypothetical protein